MVPSPKPSPARWDQLPDNLLTSISQRLGNREKASCELVCTDWHRAMKNSKVALPSDTFPCQLQCAQQPTSLL